MAAFLEQAFCYLEAKGNSLETYLPQQKKKERDAVANIIDHSKKKQSQVSHWGEPVPVYYRRRNFAEAHILTSLVCQVKRFVGINFICSLSFSNLTFSLKPHSFVK